MDLFKQWTPKRYERADHPTSKAMLLLDEQLSKEGLWPYRVPVKYAWIYTQALK
jgi:hypothetical protein